MLEVVLPSVVIEGEGEVARAVGKLNLGAARRGVASLASLFLKVELLELATSTPEVEGISANLLVFDSMESSHFRPWRVDFPLEIDMAAT